MYYLCSEKKGADQLRGYLEADLRLCFRICRLLVLNFPCGGSFSYFLSLYFTGALINRNQRHFDRALGA